MRRLLIYALTAAATAIHAAPLAASAQTPATDEAGPGTISIPVPGAESVQAQSVSYDCGDGRSVTVEYINAGPVSLAVLTMDDAFVVAASVVAASGARYAGGPYIWWSRGTDEALLEDIRDGEDASPVTCLAR